MYPGACKIEIRSWPQELASYKHASLTPPSLFLKEILATREIGDDIVLFLVFLALILKPIFIHAYFYSNNYGILPNRTIVKCTGIFCRLFALFERNGNIYICD